MEEELPTGKPEVGEYKGHSVITLPMEGPGKGFTFGVKKAEAVITFIDEIKKFVEENKKP